MALDNEFMQAINNNDFTKIRSMIANSFIIDPSTQDVKEMLIEVDKQNIPIYETHDEIDLNWDKSIWTKDYLNRVLGELLFNFSKERIDLLLKLTPYVYREYLGNQQKQQQNQNHTKPVQRNERPFNNRQTRTLPKGTATRRGPVTYKKNSSPLPYVSIGGAVVAAIGWVTSSTVATVIGCALCIGGAVGYIMTKK